MTRDRHSCWSCHGCPGETEKLFEQSLFDVTLACIWLETCAITHFFGDSSFETPKPPSLRLKNAATAVRSFECPSLCCLFDNQSASSEPPLAHCRLNSKPWLAPAGPAWPYSTKWGPQRWKKLDASGPMILAAFHQSTHIPPTPFNQKSDFLYRRIGAFFLHSGCNDQSLILTLLKEATDDD